MAPVCICRCLQVLPADQSSYVCGWFNSFSSSRETGPLVILTDQILEYQLVDQWQVSHDSALERQTILVGLLNKSEALTKYFFKVQLVDSFMPFVGVICRTAEAALEFTSHLGNGGAISGRLLLDISTPCCLVHLVLNRHDLYGTDISRFQMYTNFTSTWLYSALQPIEYQVFCGYPFNHKIFKLQKDILSNCHFTNLIST